MKLFHQMIRPCQYKCWRSHSVISATRGRLILMYYIVTACILWFKQLNGLLKMSSSRIALDWQVNQIANSLENTIISCHIFFFWWPKWGFKTIIMRMFWRHSVYYESVCVSGAFLLWFMDWIKRESMYLLVSLCIS